MERSMLYNVRLLFEDSFIIYEASYEFLARNAKRLLVESTCAGQCRARIYHRDELAALAMYHVETRVPLKNFHFFFQQNFYFDGIIVCASGIPLRSNSSHISLFPLRLNEPLLLYRHKGRGQVLRMLVKMVAECYLITLWSRLGPIAALSGCYRI